MAISSAQKIEHELLEKVSMLTLAQKREALDFVAFLSTRTQAKKIVRSPSLADFSGIIGFASGGAGETDISVNHDRYLYGDDAV
jgi:hypothetical protein